MTIYCSVLFLIPLVAFSGCTVPKNPAPIVTTAPVADGPVDWTKSYLNAREACFTYLSMPANAIDVVRWYDTEIGIPDEYHRLLLRYFWSVNDLWAQRGEFRFVVIDEEGRPVDDASREVYDLTGLGGDLEPRFRITKQKIVGEQTIKIGRNLSGLEVHIKSMNHRSIEFRLPLGQPGPYDNNRLREAHDMLQERILLPPLTTDGPVRVITPYRRIWKDGRESPNGLVDFRPNGFPRGPVPSNSPKLISTEHPGLFRVRVDGRYACVDRDGVPKVVAVCHPDALLGFVPTGAYAHSRGENWAWVEPSSRGAVATARAPFSWVLISEASHSVPPPTSAPTH